MPEVIQDSDDEDNSEINSPTHAEPRRQGRDENSIGQRETDCSTELPQCDIPEAHQYLQSSAKSSRPSTAEFDSSGSLLGTHPSKRRKLSIGFEPDHEQLFTTSRRSETIKTYRGEMGVGLVHSMARLNQEDLDHHSNPATLLALGAENSLHAEFAHHEPTTMFPDLSSTIPNNTPTQQRLYENYLSPNGPNRTETLEIMLEGEHSNSSIPSSTCITNNQEMPETQHTEHETGERDWKDKPESGKPQLDSKADNPEICTEVGKVMSTHGCGKDVAFKSNDSSSRLEGGEDTIDELSLAEGAQTQHGTTDLPTQDPSTERSGKLNSKEGRRVSLEAVDELNLDDMDLIGLPKEQYRPRPSRSRSSAFVEHEFIDYSVRPEKVAKACAKRRRTVDVSYNMASLEAGRIHTISEMGFSPSQVIAALVQTENGSTEAAVDWLLSHPSRKQDSRHAAAEQILALPGNHKHPAQEPQGPVFSHVAIPPPKSPPINANSIRVDVSSDNPSVSLHRPGKDGPQAGSGSNADRDAVQLKGTVNGMTGESPLLAPGGDQSGLSNPEINSRKQNEPPGDGKGDKPPAASSSAPPKLSQNKRGRGRPLEALKLQVSKVDEAEDRNINHSAASDDVGIQATKTDKLHRKAPEALAGADERTQSAARLKLDSVSCTDEESPPSTPSTAPAGPSSKQEVTPQKAKSSSPTHHSPLNKSRVPFRVGLSRKARIAPLLKVLKK